jgi:copper chaperone CopZ
MRQKKEVYLIEGMSCAGCEKAVQRVVAAVEGIKTVKADFTQATLAVEYDTDATTVDEIKSAVNKLGYKFVGQLPPSNQRAGSDEAVS